VCEAQREPAGDEHEQYGDDDDDDDHGEQVRGWLRVL
jgi:hypothetical protein